MTGCSDKARLARQLFHAAFLTILTVPFGSAAQSGNAAAPCESLAKLVLPDTTITAAKIVETGQFEFPPHPPGSGGYPSNMDEAKTMPPFCMVAATIRPTSDSRINIEVWLPPTGWNGKLLGAGNGGWGGRISHAMMITGILRGYAGASSDSGHDVVEDNGSGNYLLGHPEKVIDLGYRAEHEMTVKAKAIISAYYGRAPRHSYFVGSRLGGYQGLTEARRYPGDYDGIVAEAPQNSFALENMLQLWPYWLVAQDKSRTIPQEKFAVIRQAELKACDELDGAKDGVIANPLACRFDPQVLLCKGIDRTDCLTAPQVELLKKIYAGPTNSRTGEVIVPGSLPGTESEGTVSSVTGEPRPNSLDLFKYVVFQNPSWNWETFNWDSDVNITIKATSMLTTDANLKAFADSGGKLLMDFGWGNSPSAAEIVGYYNEAAKKIGAAEASGSLRLFAIPGQFNDTPFDKIDAIEQWVEQGKAPEQIIGSYYENGGLARTRLFCAYPEFARYNGNGDPNQAEHYECVYENGAN
jgi:feruloyl esterase